MKGVFLFLKEHALFGGVECVVFLSYPASAEHLCGLHREATLSHGRADCIVETDKFVYIFKFKLDGTAAEVLQQISDAGYAQPYAGDERTLYKIGCNFSSETGTIDDWIVE